MIQEYIDYPIELGILFYWEIHQNPQISSIGKKQFCTLVGNGKDSLRQLACQNHRIVHRKSTLKKRYVDKWVQIVPKGKRILLEPIGNHNRGTAFLDGLQPKLWCSNNLYGATKTQQLNSDFQQFLKLKSERHKIINFHKTKVQTYNSNEYLIKNKNLQTVSITSVISEGEVLKMRYWDMLDHKKTKFLQL